MNSNKGITIIEILVVIAIVGMLAGSASPFLSSFILRNSHNIVLDRLAGTFRKAQSYSMSTKNGVVWGVCLPNSTTIRMYRGSCNSPTFSEDYTFSDNITITGFSDITFLKHRGQPSTVVSATISSDLESNVIEINSAGRIAIQ